MISHTRQTRLQFARMAVLLLVAGLGGISTAAAQDRPVFSGRATAVTGKALGVELPPLADTGYFESEEFAETRCTQQGIAIAPLSIQASLLCATTVGQGEHSFSEANVAALDANVAGVPVTANLLRSEARAGCSAFAPVVDGNADLADARVGPLTIDADPLVPTPRNEPIPIPGVPGAYFIVGERTSSFNGNHGEITVTALRVVVPGLLPGTDTDVSFARVHADVKCQGRPVCPQPRFVTGGGFLSGKRHFVIAFRKGDLDWGHLMYSDKARGVKITADKPFTFTDVYSWPDADGAGTVTGRTTSGTSFVANVIDAGEPGRQDWFELTGVEPGYLEGGNLQVHKPCKEQ